MDKCPEEHWGAGSPLSLPLRPEEAILPAGHGGGLTNRSPRPASWQGVWGQQARREEWIPQCVRHWEHQPWILGLDTLQHCTEAGKDGNNDISKLNRGDRWPTPNLGTV